MIIAIDVSGVNLFQREPLRDKLARVKHAVIILSIPGDSKRSRDILSLTSASVEAWCARHDIELIRIYDLGELLVPGVPQCERLKLLPYFDQYDRFIYMDDTCIIAPGCPNLFDIVPEGVLGCVLEPVSLFPDRKAALRKVLDLYEVEDSNQQYFNAGMLVFSQQHRVMFEHAHLLQDSFKWDQDFFNAMVNKFNLPILDLGLSYNFLGSLIPPSIERDFDGRKISIFHLTRGCHGHANRLKYGRRINQRIEHVECTVRDSLAQSGLDPVCGLDSVQAADILREMNGIERCRLMVAGPGAGSDFWQRANHGGSTVRYPFIDIRGDEAQDPRWMPLLNGKRWDLVVIDASCAGKREKDAGARVQSWARELLKRNPDLIVYLVNFGAKEKTLYPIDHPQAMIRGRNDLLKLDRALGQAARPPAPRLVFLFIARKDINQQRLWERFFAGADRNRYACFLYSISETEAPGIPRLTHFGNSQDPQYGHHSYVRTVLMLLRQGLKDPRNQKFILLSESCIPLNGFESIYRELMNEPRSQIYHFTVGNGNEKDISPDTPTQFMNEVASGDDDIRQMFQGFYGPRAINHMNLRYGAIRDKSHVTRQAFPKFQAQGITFSRDFARFLLQTQGDLDEFEDVRFIEEHYYLCPLLRRGIPFERYISKKNLMSVVWRGAKPREYRKRSEMDTLTPELVDLVRSKGLCFLRKLPDCYPIDDVLSAHILGEPLRPKGLILTYCSGYGEAVYERFRGSLLETGFDDALVMFLQQEDLPHARAGRTGGRSNVTLQVIEPELPGKYERYFRYRDYLREDQGLAADDWVFLCDSRDVIFQKNLFDHPFDPDDDLLLFEENSTIGSCKWNAYWMQRFGNPVFEQLKEETILCSGTLLGKKAAVLDYLDTMLSIIKHEIGLEKIREGGSNYGGDQGIFNYLFHTGRLRHLNIRRLAWNHPLLLTAHFGPAQINESGRVVDDNGREYWCVHQFDRMPREQKLKLDELNPDYDLLTRFGTN
jgi:hypothetical protein